MVWATTAKPFSWSVTHGWDDDQPHPSGAVWLSARSSEVSLRLRLEAHTATWVRLRVPVFRKIDFTWTFTVASVISN